MAIRVDPMLETASIADAMRRLADDGRLRAELGRAGHAYSEAARSTIDHFGLTVGIL